MEWAKLYTNVIRNHMDIGSKKIEADFKAGKYITSYKCIKYNS